MGLDAGYSKAASRRIAVWEATTKEAAAKAAADTAKTKFDVPASADKATEAAPTPPPPNNANQMSSEMLNKLLSMVSELSDRFTKQEVGVEFAIDFLKEGKKASEALSKELTDISGKIEKIASDLTSLNDKVDGIAAVGEPPADAQPDPDPGVQSAQNVKTSSAQDVKTSAAAVTLSAIDAVTDKTTSATAATTPLDPRFSALTA